ncbi:MAG: hypothetical protein JWO31_273 [Phycisphaerales bacterium]|nr:hypothetical protein [Phycisphaerales bacterium]
MVTVQQQARPCSRSGSAYHRPGVEEELRRRFPPRRLGYIARVLTAEEMAVLPDAADALIVARIKRMSDPRLAGYDRLIPADARAERQYHALQLQWLREEEYLLGTRLGRRPTPRELCADFAAHRNGSRFRAYFAMKYPRQMRSTGRRASVARATLPAPSLAVMATATR